MKALTPYWFLEEPIDQEHKYYVLMAYLKQLEDDFQGGDYLDQLRSLNSMMRNLKYYRECSDFLPRVIKDLKESEVKKLRKMEKAVESTGKKGELDLILESSISTIEEFLEKNESGIKGIEDLVQISVNKERKRFFWDKGYLIIRNHTTDKILVYLWKFSPIKIKGEEQIALLMSPCYPEDCNYDMTLNEEDIEKKLKQDFGGSYNTETDPVVIVELLKPQSDMVIESDFGKDKASDYIVNTYKDFLKKF